MKISGIYVIFNKISKKLYIGSSKDIIARFRKHKSTLERDKHHNTHLQRSFNKYGAQAFKFSILERELCEADLLTREQFWLNKVKNKFNLCPFAGRTSGRLATADTRRKLSIIASKRTGSRNYWFRKSLHPNTLAQAKKVCAIKFKGAGNPFWKKTHSKKTKRLLSQKLTGRKMPKSFLQKQSGNTRGSKTYRITFSDGRIITIKNLKRYCLENGYKTQSVRSAMYFGRPYRCLFFEVV